MKPLAEPIGRRHHLACLAGAIALIALSLLMATGRADADQIYWVNHESVAYSALDDTAGGFLPDSVFAIHNGRGTAIDTANGRIYVAQAGSDQIAWFALEGNGAGVVNTAPGSVDQPTNISIDPVTQTLYWANDSSPGSIGFAYTNESGGGILAAPGSTVATVRKPSRLALDTLHNRVYWWNEESDEFSWVTTDGLSGGNLSTPGLAIATPEGMGGIALEPYSTPEELYFVDNESRGIFHTDPLLGGAPEEIQGAYGEKNAFEPIGLAFDGTNNKFYWANSQNIEEPKNAIGTASIFGRPALIPVFPVAPLHHPVFAAILKEPVATGEPQVTVSGDTLSCTLGEWQGDQPGASVYVAPTTLAYQWRKGSEEIAGATGGTFTATESGSYTCQVTAANASGETVKSSHATSLTFPSKPKTTTSTSTTSTSTSKPKPTPAAVGAKLASSKPVKVKAGGTAVISVDLDNTGGTTSGSVKVCGTLAKGAKKGLKPPVCVTVKSVAAGKTEVAKLQAKTLASAKGTYKLTVSVGGAAKASLTAKVQVTRTKR